MADDKPGAAMGLSVAGGVIILLVGIPFIILFGLGIIAVVCGLVIVVGALAAYSSPSSSTAWGVIILVLSLVSWLGGGGLFIGFILALVGGILFITWEPVSVPTQYTPGVYGYAYPPPAYGQYPPPAYGQYPQQAYGQQPPQAYAQYPQQQPYDPYQQQAYQQQQQQAYQQQQQQAYQQQQQAYQQQAYQQQQQQAYQQQAYQQQQQQAYQQQQQQQAYAQPQAEPQTQQPPNRPKQPGQQ